MNHVRENDSWARAFGNFATNLFKNGKSLFAW